MMKTANLEKITDLNRKQATVTALGGMMSIFQRRNPLMKSKNAPIGNRKARML